MFAEEGSLGKGSVKPVGAGVVRKGVGTLASPIVHGLPRWLQVGDASVPTPHNPTPAPTDITPLQEPGGEFRDGSCCSRSPPATYQSGLTGGGSLCCSR